MTDKELLQQRVKEASERLGRTQKERYALARKLGFTSQEAAILQNWSEERILALVEKTTEKP